MTKLNSEFHITKNEVVKHNPTKFRLANKDWSTENYDYFFTWNNKKIKASIYRHYHSRLKVYSVHYSFGYGYSEEMKHWYYGVPDAIIQSFQTKKEADLFMHDLLSKVNPEEDIEKISDFYKNVIKNAEYYDKKLE